MTMLTCILALVLAVLPFDVPPFFPALLSVVVVGHLLFGMRR